MRAILIDPETRSLTEIQIDGSLGSFYAAIGCEDVTSGAHLGGWLENGFDGLLVSDDMLEDGDDPRFWFQVDADRATLSSYPIAGRGLATGVDKEGATCDVRIGIDELRSRITFTQRKFRGFTTYTGAEAQARGADIVTVVHAPIIDGTEG